MERLIRLTIEGEEGSPIDGNDVFMQRSGLTDEEIVFMLEAVADAIKVKMKKNENT